MPCLYTIGSAGKRAEQFFEKLSAAGVKRVIDVRLNNRSQLCGFTKEADLQFFLSRLAGIEYLHLPNLAPTPELLAQYRETGDWEHYKREFRELIARRRVEQEIPLSLLDGSCLLCSEASPHHCHRRIAAEYLRANDPRLEIVHL